MEELTRAPFAKILGALCALGSGLRKTMELQILPTLQTLPRLLKASVWGGASRFLPRAGQ